MADSDSGLVGTGLPNSHAVWLSCSPAGGPVKPGGCSGTGPVAKGLSNVLRAIAVPINEWSVLRAGRLLDFAQLSKKWGPAGEM